MAQKIGETKFSVFLDDILVCSSKTVVCEGEDASKCRAVGDGLERGVVNQSAKFRIDTQVVSGVFVTFRRFSKFYLHNCCSLVF